MPFSVGDLIDEHYRVEQRFAGGMGFVYIVMDEIVRKRFAIKQLSELHAENEILRERFRREAATWLQLDYHPHIVQAHSYMPRAEGPMLILEFVDGPSLDALLRAEKLLSQAQVIAYGRQFCSAMLHAHNRPIPDRGIGVLHRDIKPGNLLVTRTNQLKVTDFGLAKIQGDTNLTSEGQFVGTVAYSSPEQLRAAGDVTKRSDVYSFGTVMYQMLTGQQAFRATNPAELYFAIQETEAKSPADLCPDVDPALARIVTRCLKKDPAARFGDFAELDAALAGLKKVVAGPQERVCGTCGFVSRRKTTKCSVCGSAGEAKTEPGPADSAVPRPRSKTSKCVCGATLSDSAQSCSKCGRNRSDRPGSDPSRSWPLTGASEAPSHVPGLSDTSPVCAAEQKSSWNLDSGKEYLVELRSGGIVLPWPLERTGYTIGSAENMKIRLKDPKVARYQLFLVRLPCGWLAINPQANTHMEVNGWETKQCILHPADLVKVGMTWLAYVGPSGGAESMTAIPGRWPELAPPKAQTIKSGGSNVTTLNSPTATACVLETPGEGKFVSRGQPLRIGTSPVCDVRLQDSSATPVQALLVWQSDGPHLINVTGGLVRLLGGGEIIDRLMQDGDLLQIGATPVRVRIEGDPLVPGRRWAAATAAAPGRFSLSVLTGSQKGQTAVLALGQPVTLGRHSDCELVLSADTFVSRRHLEIVARESEVEIKDLSSRSGFFLNQTHFPQSAVGRLGDVVVVGKTSMLIHHELDAE